MISDRRFGITIVLIVAAAVAVATPLIQQARRAKAEQSESHMTPVIQLPTEPAPIWCTCLKDFAAIAEMYGRAQ